MLFVLSPAKTLDFSAPPPGGPEPTRPAMVKEIKALAGVAKTLKRADLRALMSISDELADLNVKRFKAFRLRPRPGATVPAVLAFAGDVYTGLRARELDAAALVWAQAHLRILSGLYGILRPLDAIQPYRLEMGVKLATDRGESLHQFWGDTLAKALNSAARGQADKTVVNLASQEYFGGVDKKALRLPVVTCLFKQELPDGSITHPAFYAKVARGLMARYAIDTRAERIDDLKSFDREGYGFRAALSSKTDFVFVRPHP